MNTVVTENSSANACAGPAQRIWSIVSPIHKEDAAPDKHKRRGHNATHAFTIASCLTSDLASAQRIVQSLCSDKASREYLPCSGAGSTCPVSHTTEHGICMRHARMVTFTHAAHITVLSAPTYSEDANMDRAQGLNPSTKALILLPTQHRHSPHCQSAQYRKDACLPTLVIATILCLHMMLARPRRRHKTLNNNTQ